MSCRALIVLLALLCALPGAARAESIEETYRAKDAAIAVSDADGHYQLSMWCRTNDLPTHGREQLEKTISINPDHEQARRLLGFERIDGKWLKGDDAMLAKGMVQLNGKWVTKEFADNTAKGLVQYQNKWMSVEDMNKARGYVKYHGTWISPARLKSVQARQAEARERIKFSSDWKNAWVYKTDEGHFIIKSNVSPQSVQEIGKAMEQCFAELSRVFSARSNIKAIEVDVSATQEQFMDVSNKAGIHISENVLGYFYFGQDIGIRCFYAGSLDRTLSTLFHECTHLVIHQACSDNVPTWANEGLAVFFESAERDDKGMKLQTIPFDRLWQLKSIMKHGEVSLNTLCMLQGQAQYGAIYYPQGWSLIYYMLYADAGRHRDQFQNFYAALTRGKYDGDSIGLFKKSFGASPDDLKSDWQSFFEKLEPKTTGELVAAANAAYTAWLDFDAAREFADQALKSSKTKDDKVLLCNARLYLTLGRWEADPRQRDANFAKSVDFFEQVMPTAAGAAKSLRPPKLNAQYCQDHLDFAKACIGARRYEQAQALIDDLLAKKEFEFNGDAYSALAFLAISADDPGFHDLETAKENVAIADDLGADQDNKYVHALIELEGGRRDKAVGFLAEAAARDEFGFGGQFYRREIARLTAAARRKQVDAADPDPQGETGGGGKGAAPDGKKSGK